MIKVRKDNPRKFKPIKAKSGVPVEDLGRAKIIRKTTNRSKFQYQLVLPNGKKLEFRNFKEVNYYINRNLLKPPLYIEIEKEGGIGMVKFSIFEEDNNGCIC